MNNRNVLKAYSLLQQMTPDELAMLNLLRGLSESEREQLVEMLGPQGKAGKKSTATKPRKIEHCDVCDTTRRAAVHKDTSLKDYHEFQSSKPKSARGQSLQQQLQAARPLDGGVSKMRCAREGCGEYVDNNVHHKTTYPDYHEFEAQEQAAGASGD